MDGLPLCADYYQRLKKLMSEKDYSSSIGNNAVRSAFWTKTER